MDSTVTGAQMFPGSLALPPAVMLVGIAVACWPAAPPRLPVRACATAVADNPARRIGGRPRAVLPLVFGAVVGTIVGVAVGLAAAALIATLAGQVRRRRRDAVAAVRQTDLAGAIRAFGAELRSGAEVAGAAEAAGRTAGPAGRRLLSGVAGAARLGRSALLLGDGVAGLSVVEDRVVARVQAAWTLSHRHGIPLAELVDQVAEAVAADLRADGRRRADLAGPRLSGYLLGGLPVLGLLLGGGMGVNPAQVLLGPGFGQILLLGGVLFTCAGLLWSGRISR